MTELSDAVVAIIARHGYDRRKTPFQLSSAGLSRDYIDAKRALSLGSHLKLVGEAVAEVAHNAGVTFSAVGGLTMGADPIAMAVAISCDVNWFSVRKIPKSHGTQKKIEGVELERGAQVLLVDDVVTTGRSIIQALDALQELHVNVVMAVPMMDRGDVARGKLEGLGIRYEPVITFRDLGIEPTHREQDVA